MKTFNAIPISEYEREAGKPRPKFKRTGTPEIMATEYPPIRWIVPGYLPEGFSVLAGRQKLGKTWLALDFAIAAASGGYALGAIPCDAGDVLYIDMENGHRRIQRRIEALFPGEERPSLDRLEWVTDAPALNAGFIDALEDWRQSVANPRLVIIDVLQRIKPAGKANQNAYESDYSTFADLQRWATQNGVAVLGLHHTRKGGADDPLEALSGSNGLSAVADTTLVLDRDANGTTLYVRGRDVEEVETALRFDGGNWSLLGDAGKVRMSHERVTILNALQEADGPLSPRDVTDVTGMPYQNVRQILSRMARSNEIKKLERGKYSAAVDPDPLSQPSQSHNDMEDGSCL